MVAMPEPDERAAFRVRLGANLNRYRRASKVTQEQIATRLGVNTGTIGRWERGGDGDGSPDSWELAVMIDVYKVPCAWLLDPTGDVNVLRQRTEQLRRAAQGAGQADAADAPSPPAGGGNGPQPRRGLS